MFHVDPRCIVCNPKFIMSNLCWLCYCTPENGKKGLSWPMFLKPLAPHLIPATEMFNTASVHAIGILDARSLVPLLLRRFALSVGICWPSGAGNPSGQTTWATFIFEDSQKQDTRILVKLGCSQALTSKKKNGPPGFFHVVSSKLGNCHISLSP